MRLATPTKLGFETKTLACLLAAAALTAPALGQGCIAVRGACSLLPEEAAKPADAGLESDDWLATVGYRHIHSMRHYVGDVEQTQRQVLGNQVINSQNFLDFSLQYAITPRWSIGATLPYETSSRSQVAVINGSNFRYSTHAGGIGDAQVTAYAWLLDPSKPRTGNIQLGLGIKLPTGVDNATDTFYRNNGTTFVHPVDQSIQPGDGGWGATVSLNAYQVVLPKTVAFLQAFYLFNPQDVNGVATARGSTGPGSAGYYEQVMSVPDQYFARGGLSYVLVPKWGLSFSIAGRLEGIPPRDLIGDSDGFRRPGFIASVEPGIEVMKGRYTFNLSMPWAVVRNRQLSVADSRASAVLNNGTEIHGDAAFADFAVVASFSVRF
jgi:hypothetical protein